MALISAVSSDTPERNIWISKPLMPSSGITPRTNTASPRPLGFVILRSTVFAVCGQLWEILARLSFDIQWIAFLRGLQIPATFIINSPCLQNYDLLNWTTSVQHHSKVKLTVSARNLRLDCLNESSFNFPETSIFECSSLERIYFSRKIKNSHLH